MKDCRDTITAVENLDLTSVILQLNGYTDLVGLNIVELVSEYRRFLAVKVLHEDTGLPACLSPSTFVGRVWRAHLLNPGHYIRCCNKLGVDAKRILIQKSAVNFPNFIIVLSGHWLRFY